MKIKMLSAIAGSNFSFQAGQILEVGKHVSQAEAARWKARQIAVDYAAGELETAHTAGAPETASTRVSASKAAADLARDHGIDLASIAGTGRNGSITKPDVERAISDRI